MATSENPFPSSLKSSKKQSSATSYYSGMIQTNKQTIPPLYYDETINVSISRNDEMSFDS